MSAQLGTAGGGGSGRGRRTASASARARTSSAPRVPSSLPKAWKACQGWTDTSPTTVALEVLSEEEFSEKYLRDYVLGTYAHIATSMASSCQISGMPNTQMSWYFKLFPDTVMSKVVEYTNQELARRGLQSTNLLELRQILALMWARTRYKFSTDILWANEFATKAEKLHFILPEEERYTNVVNSFRAYPLEGRRGDHNDVWNQPQTCFASMRELERDIFHPSVKILMNLTNGTGTLDDELIGSRAKDVERKTLSARKRGKDGPVADCFACSATNIVYAMSLRARGESEMDNIKRVMGRLPNITHHEHTFAAGFDRGYGKRPTISEVLAKNYNLITFAAASGSEHPFLTQDEVDKKCSEWRAKGKGPSWIKERVDFVKDFILPNDTNQGSIVRVAEMEFEYADGKTRTLYAFAVHEVYDRKASKWLRLYATGNFPKETKHVFVGTKREAGISSSILFNKGASTETAAYPERETVENTLKTTCGPLCLVQRSSDWFNGKAMRICGTAAGQIFTCQEFDAPGALEDEDVLRKMLDKLIDSWFGRHVSTDKMKLGSLNEVPVVERLQQYEWVENIFECGVLELTEHPYLGVSPDGIGTIPQGIASFEIKTRQSVDTTIAQAQEAVADHGAHVECQYDDEVFKKCVPSDNRKQVMQQAFVTGLHYVVFVTAKLEDGEGSIVQTVVVDVPNEAKQEYSDKIVPRAKALVGWLHDPAVIEKGYLEDEDFPSWLTDEQKALVRSRYQLWAAQEKKVKSVSAEGAVTYHPTEPVHVYKHSSQAKYNPNKWGLDKNTEVTESLKLPNTTPFEPKYLFRMFAAQLCGLWRVEQAVTIVMPYVEEYRRDHQGQDPSADQIRQRTWELSMDDFVYKFSFNLLQHLQQLNAQPRITRWFMTAAARARAAASAASAGAARSSQTSNVSSDDEVASIIHRFGSKWPIKRNRAQQFGGEELTKVRLHSTDRFAHTPQKIPNDTSKEKRLPCTLCSNGREVQRNTRYHCSVCMVPLCLELLHGRTKTCFEIWHEEADLATACRLASERLLAIRSENRQKRAREEANEDAVAAPALPAVPALPPIEEGKTEEGYVDRDGLFEATQDTEMGDDEAGGGDGDVDMAGVGV